MDEKSDENEILNIAYQLYKKIIKENIEPFSILTDISEQLQAYQDCAEKGENKDIYPSFSLKNQTDLYRWIYWKNTTLKICKETWALEKFKQVAMQYYIKMARNCINDIRNSIS